MNALYTVIPAYFAAQRRGADSDSPGCMHTAHQTGCRLRDRLQKFERGER